jgi:hypothetical protein
MKRPIANAAQNDSDFDVFSFLGASDFVIYSTLKLKISH